jgi:hypothetical protein
MSGVALALALAAAACGGGSKSTEIGAEESPAASQAAAATATTATSAAKDACALATAGEIQTALDRPTTAATVAGLDERTTTAGGYKIGTACSYADSAGMQVAVVSIGDKFRHYTTRKSGAGDSAQDVSGYGDGAWCFQTSGGSSPTNELNVLKGSASLRISVPNASSCDEGPKQIADVVVPRFS